MIFRILSAILLGGGALGAAAGWMTIKYLEARRQQIKRVVSRPVVPPRKPPSLNYTDFSPGAVWQVPADRRHMLEAQEQIQRWIDEEKKRRES